MKGLRAAVVGLVLVLCWLGAAPAASACDAASPTRCSMLAARDWVVDRLAQVAAWFGWEQANSDVPVESASDEEAPCTDRHGDVVSCTGTKGDGSVIFDPNG
jgi:hypothetical protein